MQNMQEHHSLHDQQFPKNIYHYQFDLRILKKNILIGDYWNYWFLLEPIFNIGLYVAFTQSAVIVVLEKQCTTDGTSVCIQSICT